MTMIPYNGDILQALKWMQSTAPNIQSLVTQKSNWYQQYQNQFWTDWETNIFKIATASPFGLMVWCIILGVPSSIFGLYDVGKSSWAYGANRQNFKYSGGNPSLPDKNLEGGNFFGGGNTTIINLQEARWALMLRYVTLVSNGKISFINKMLRWIFNADQPWDFPNKKYFYVTDLTSRNQTLTTTAPVNAPLYMEYRIGAAMNFSPQFFAVLGARQNGITPNCAGISFNVIQES